MRSKAEINEYLMLEFGEDASPAASDESPFQLREIGSLRTGTRVLEFSDAGGEYFVLDGESLNFLPKEGLTIQELELQVAGAAWIGKQNPVDLGTSKLGDPSIPPAVERKAILLKLASSLTQPEVVEGLYLPKIRAYLGLFRSASGERFVIGSFVGPIACGSRNLSGWRELSIQVGKLLAANALLRF